MNKEFILVSKHASDKLFKNITDHIDNNPLVIARYNPRTGKRIDIKVGNNLSNLVSLKNGEYYYIDDVTVTDCQQLNPEEISTFLLANASRSLNVQAARYNDMRSDISSILFECIVGSFLYSKSEYVIKTFP